VLVCFSCGFVCVCEVSLEVKTRVVKVTGPRGTLTRNLQHLQLELSRVTDGETGANKLRVDLWGGRRKQIACINSLCSAVNNLITGVTKGYQFKMRFVYAHFPINVTVADDEKAVEIRNFLGEKRVRKVNMLDGVRCYRSETTKDELIVEGNDLNNVSQSAASVHQSCLVKEKDIRMFLDGIYVSEKGHIQGDE